MDKANFDMEIAPLFKTNRTYESKNQIVISNNAGLKTYLNLAVKSSKSEEDIYTALTGLTFNGVKADKIAITRMRSVA